MRGYNHGGNGTGTVRWILSVTGVLAQYNG